MSSVYLHVENLLRRFVPILRVLCTTVTQSAGLIIFTQSAFRSIPCRISTYRKSIAPVLTCILIKLIDFSRISEQTIILCTDHSALDFYLSHVYTRRWVSFCYPTFLDVLDKRLYNTNQSLEVRGSALKWASDFLIIIYYVRLRSETSALLGHQADDRSVGLSTATISSCLKSPSSIVGFTISHV